MSNEGLNEAIAELVIERQAKLSQLVLERLSESFPDEPLNIPLVNKLIRYTWEEMAALN